MLNPKSQIQIPNPKFFIFRFLDLKFSFEFCVLRFKFIQILLIVLILLSFPNFIIAVESNNKFGIHLAQPHLEALSEAAKLVNSQGGDWGYVTLVMQENDRKFDKWQEIFNQLRKLHLIPIIRLATSPEGEVWRRPKATEAKDWADFLDSLNWVVKKRYVVLFNEPNHGSEWGGEVDAKNYAEVATEFAKVLKEKDPDFFIMLAGLDASAPQSPPNFEDEEIFLQKVFEFIGQVNEASVVKGSGSSSPNTETGVVTVKRSTLFDLIDGWSSHSYPNPGFSGSPWDTGRGTVKTYEWELETLKRLGITKELPVFITETGWVRQVQNEEKVAENFQVAFENVWQQDKRVMAVTPFVLDYQSPPFLDFSWQKPGVKEFYKQYFAIQSLPKIKGEPEQINRGEIFVDLPHNLVAQSNYHLKIKLKNTGQALWDKNDNYELQIADYKDNKENFLISDIKNIVPFEEKEIDVFLKTSEAASNKSLKFVLEKDKKKILASRAWQFNILPLPSLSFQVNLFPKLNDRGDDFEIQFFDEKENLVFQKKQQEAYGGRGRLTDIQNVIVGARYRVVILKPYYLPRQNFLVMKNGENQIKFKIMLPFDFDLDGKLSFFDFFTLLKNPKLFKLLLP
jgi:hypothetical protein